MRSLLHEVDESSGLPTLCVGNVYGSAVYSYLSICFSYLHLFGLEGDDGRWRL